MDLRRLHRCKFAVIGQATGRALADRGILADLCPETATSAALGAQLCSAVKRGEEALLFRSASSDSALADALADRRIAVRDFDLYDAVFTPGASREAVDYLVFASAGGVKAYFKTHKTLPEGATVICIGPVSAQELKKWTPVPFLTAPEISAEGIVRCAQADWGRRNQPKE